ncbi:hypothetical protein NUW58_g8472 [Xylaria curta]|uniref:Uncharacterized protein n=1 Tax=Xylaria curta TaxID=42375 RepID=A0ACC1N6X5_9PEZI|nr:hypothetical protein NUW58_g8472 [Xylaria curta]
MINYLGTKDLAAVTSTCRWLYILANPLLYKLEAQDPESYTFYTAAGSGNVDLMQKLVDAGFDVNRPWYSSVSAARLEYEQMMDSWRQGKCSEESFLLYLLTKTKRDAKAAQFSYRSAQEENGSNLEETLPPVSRGLAAANNTCFWTALHVATANGEDEAVSFLINNRARINAPSRNFCLCRHVHACLFKRMNIRETRSPPQWSPLHLAICRGHLSTATLLLRRGASIVVEVDGLSDDASMDQSTTPENGFRCTALHAACFFGMFSLVKTLMEDGYQSEVDIGYRFGQTPLAYAFCAGNFTPFIPYLQSRGSDINVTLGRHRRPRPYRASPLLTACNAYRYEDANELIKLGADVNALDNEDNTPLHICAEEFSGRGKRDETIQRLLEAGAKVMLLNREGLTPLHYAVESLDTQTAKILIQYGADASVYDPYGNTLVARLWDNLAVFPSKGDIKGMMDLLTSHGINVNERNNDNLTALHQLLCFFPLYWGVDDFCTVLKVLLSYGADVALRDNSGLLPFHKAFRRSFLEVCPLLFTEEVSMLLTEYDIFDMFLWIFRSGDQGCITRSFNILLDSGGRFLLSRPETLKTALDCDADYLVPLLISKDTFEKFISNSGDTVLHRGCQSGMFKRETIIAQLLDSDIMFDANIMNQNSETILYEYLATIKQRYWHELYPTVQRLLKRGADPHRLVKQIPSDYHTDYSQCDRPLDIVIHECQFKIAGEILQQYPVLGDVSGYSYLHHSCSFQRAPPDYDLILQLLQHGFDANGVGSFGETPLCHMLRTFKPGLPMPISYTRSETNILLFYPYMAIDHIGTLMTCIGLLLRHGARWNTRCMYSLDGRWTALQELQHLLAYNGEHTQSRSEMYEFRKCLSEWEWDIEDVGEDFFLFKEVKEEEEAHEVQH